MKEYVLQYCVKYLSQTTIWKVKLELFSRRSDHQIMKTQKITSPEVSSKLFFIIIPLNLGCRYFDSALTKAKAIAIIMTRNLNSNIVTNWVHQQLAVG